MLKAALLCLDRVPGNALDLPLNGLPVKIRQLDARSRDHRQIAIGEKEKIARVMEYRRNIGGDEVFVVSQPDYRRRSIAAGNNFVGLIGTDDHQRKDPGKLLYRLANRILERWTRAIVTLQSIFNQVRDDFGVGLGRKLVTFLNQALLERQVVFDNAGVNDHNA